MCTCGVYCRCLSWLQLAYYGSSCWQGNTIGDSHFTLNKGLMLDQQLSQALDGVHTHYIEFHTLQSSYLSYTGFAQGIFTKVFCQCFKNAHYYYQSFLLYGSL